MISSEQQQRVKSSTRPIYEFAEFQVDVSKRLVRRRDGSLVPVPPRVFETLLYMVEHNGTVLEKDHLMDAIWPDTTVEENNLTQHISTLRRILGEEPGSHRFIVTVPGRGYRFVADVKRSENKTTPTANGLTDDATPVQTSAGQVATASEPRLARPIRKLSLITVATTALLLLFGLVALLLLRDRAHIPLTNTSQPAVVIPEKSIAVLPFSNLSADQENAFFTEGMQEDILTALAKSPDLKVISRTSVASYIAGSPRNLREIGKELGVSRVLEGSVRRAGERVRVTAQLIDTRSNTHVWAETYDRDLSDVFAIQTEIAQKIATASKAKLAPEEKVQLGLAPTPNSQAYVLYLTARGKERENQIQAEQLFLQAIVIDPTFALAWARASLLNTTIAASAQSHERKAKARTQAEEALRLAPALGEAHMALGLCLYWGEKKYDAALKEFEIAAVTLPNNPELEVYVGGIYRRQGRWREALTSFDHAFSLDPRNARFAVLNGNSHLFVRDWPAAAAAYTRAQELEPEEAFSRIGLAYVEVYRNENPAAGRTILGTSDSHILIALARRDLAVLERDYVVAEKILSDIPEGELVLDEKCPKAFFQGQTALARGDIESAQRYFATATPILEGLMRDNPDDPDRHALLGLAYAYMQRKADALREVHQAVELDPENQDAFHGAEWTACLALIDALIGEHDEAIALIERLLTIPGLATEPPPPWNMTLADLRLRWEWDALRSDPRFEKIVADLAPKEASP